MNSKISSHQLQTIVPVPLTPLQNQVVSLIRAATNQIAKDVITALISARNMPAESFIDTNITKRINNCSHLDKRTQQFARNILAVVDEDLNKIPSLSQSFEVFATYARDPHIRKKFISIVAYPVIIKLVKDFDSIKPSIINDINAYYENKNPSFKTKFLRLIQATRLPKLIILEKTSLTFPMWQKVTVIVTCVLIGLTYFNFTSHCLPNQQPSHILKEFGNLLINLSSQTNSKINVIVTYENPYKSSANWNTFKTIFNSHVNIPYSLEESLEQSKEFISILDKLTSQECQFQAFSNLTFAYDLMNFVLINNIRSNCIV